MLRIMIYRGHAANFIAASATLLLATGMFPEGTIVLGVLAGGMWLVGTIESAATELSLSNKNYKNEGPDG